MKRLVLLPLTLLIMLVFSSSIYSAEIVTDSDPQDGVPTVGGLSKIQCDEMVHDFGKVYQHESLKHTFTFRNIGTGILLIKKVKAG